MCGFLEEVLVEVGLENIVQLVTNNATTCVDVGSLLIDRHPTSLCTPCKVQFIDTMMEDIGMNEAFITMIG